MIPAFEVQTADLIVVDRSNGEGVEVLRDRLMMAGDTKSLGDHSAADVLNRIRVSGHRKILWIQMPRLGSTEENDLRQKVRDAEILVPRAPKSPMRPIAKAKIVEVPEPGER